MKPLICWIATACLLQFASTTMAAEIRVTPYGFILLNGSFNSRIASDIPVKASPSDTGAGRKTFLITARQTRLGLRLRVDSLQSWTANGQVEVDFWGQKGSFGNGASMQSAPRLRLAYFTLKKGNLQVLFGQDWACFAPSNPNSLAHVSVPAFSSSGNLWNRLPQIRLDYTAGIRGDNSILVQVAAVRPIAGDITDDSQAEVLGAGEFGGMPFGQMRLAFSSGKRLTLGASAHLGQERWQKAYPAAGYAADRTTTLGVAGDAKITVGIATFSAEGFVGGNLIMLFSSAGTFTDPSDARKKVEGVDVKGGWGEIAIKPNGSKVSMIGGAGIEILNGDQVAKTVISAANNKLWKNFTLFGVVMYDPLSNVTMALEAGYIRTTYKHLTGNDLGAERHTNLNVNGGFRLSF